MELLIGTRLQATFLRQLFQYESSIGLLRP